MDKQTKREKTNLPAVSPIRSLLLVVAVIFCSEAIIMLFLQKIVVDNRWYEMLIDSFLLCLVVLPTLFFFQYKPLSDQLREKDAFQLKLEKLITYSAVPMFVLDSNHQVLYWNQACEDLTGVEAEEMIGTTNHGVGFYSDPRDCLADVLINKTMENYPGYYDKYVISGLLNGGLRAEGWVPMLHGDPRYLVIDAVPICDETDELLVVVETIQDISDRKKLEDELANLASTDALTGVLNRHRFKEVILSEITRAKRYGNSLSLIMFDLDFFKNINDTYGHNTGDMVLRQAAQIIQENIRETDVVARWGGEEFLVLCPESSKEEAIQIADKLRLMVERYSFEEVQGITMSCGVTDFQDEDTMDIFINRADEALYLAKEQGRNTVVAG